jgi:DNA-binding transcriptional regulator YiaG
MKIELALAERVRKTRAHLDMSVAQFADAMGVSVQTVYSWEQGRRVPRASTMKLMDRLVKEKGA